MLSPAVADMAMQQQHHHHNCVNNNVVVVPYDISNDQLVGSMAVPLFHGFVSAEVLDFQGHKNNKPVDDDTFLGAHNFPTFGNLSLAAAAAGNKKEEAAPPVDNNTIVVVEKRTEVEAKLESISKPKKRARAVTTTTTTSSENNNSKAGSSAVHKPNYIHVRARRGQATDSHSLAERVSARREKISRKMKCLQDLVPGCSNIIGKAGMLDEIINYVQSLQRQVEFLSMKLATQNPGPGFNIDNFSAAHDQQQVQHLLPTWDSSDLLSLEDGAVFDQE
ncbi:hypothetical protein EZV62_014233 [Acer yangbiense]|uniref:BHLH domain-containing protein n=1 Tax=Acer yangbiense TaxID=1000413 RepID=A0A5C7HRQ3_9ROSI|nr:hypothetical protein EZV62_014233 [Acer yangbiense]